MEEVKVMKMTNAEPVLPKDDFVAKQLIEQCLQILLIEKHIEHFQKLYIL